MVIVLKEEMIGVKISLIRICEKMEVGEMEEVMELLGYIYEIEGIVVYGDVWGCLLGFLIVNVKVKSIVCLLRIGVYVV